MIWLPQHALNTIETWADEAAPAETGGVLIGYLARFDSEIVVTSVIGPGPHARHSLTRFSPDLRFQHEQIAKIYFESGRVYTYVGDWHTHPAGSLSPSRIDKSALMRVARSREARLPVPTMLIFGGGKGDWRNRAWQFIPGRLFPRRIGKFREVRVRVYSDAAT